MVPARAGEGRAGYVQRAAVDVARQAAQHGPRLGIGAADRQAEGGVFAQVEVEGAVQRVGLAPFVVDERIALVFIGDKPSAHGPGVVKRAAGIQLQAIVIPAAGLAGEGHGRGALAALAHQVDRATRAAGAL
ncbi:hypothetical protein D9M71_463860 [compost metagenome]